MGRSRGIVTIGEQAYGTCERRDLMTEGPGKMKTRGPRIEAQGWPERRVRHGYDQPWQSLRRALALRRSRVDEHKTNNVIVSWPLLADGWVGGMQKLADFLADLGPVVTLQPVDDAYLSSSGSEADQTWNSTELAQHGYYGASKRPLLKFDLSSIPDGATLTSAQLVLQQTGSYGGEGYFTTLARMTNDNWFETNVTWNSYNQTGAAVVATLPFESGGTKTWQINLATWAYAEDLADDAVTFMVRWDVDIYGGTEGDGVYKSRKYSSKEGSAPPTLQIEYVTGSATPALAVFRTTTNTVVVSWPSPSTGWDLQQNTNSVSSVNWSNVTSGVVEDGATRTLIVNPPTGNRFYRLHKP